MGETPKNICAAFAAAAREGAVIFFDEADSILGRRLTQVTQAADHGVNVSRAVMLKQLDEFAGVVVFATNLQTNFDGAFVRRILMHIEVPVPDSAQRQALWWHMVPEVVPGREQIAWNEIIACSEGLTGGEIKNVVIHALARVADRPPAQRLVDTHDFLESVAVMHQSKRAIDSAY